VHPVEQFHFQLTVEFGQHSRGGSCIAVPIASSMWMDLQQWSCKGCCVLSTRPESWLLQ